MASEYQHIRDYDGVLRYVDNATVPPDPANRDWQQWLAYTEAGGTTDPAPLPPEPPPPEPVALPPVMPTEPNDAAPKAYVDVEVAKLAAGVLPRIEALESKLA
jgi:hypothetical protein